MVARASRLGRVLLLLALVPLAGCLGGGDPPDPLEATGEPEPEPVRNATLTTKPFQWEDRVDTRADGCTASTCMSSGAEREHPLVGVVSADLTLTWDGDTRLSIRVEPCARSCTYAATGDSPLKLDVARLPADTEHFLVVEHAESEVVEGMRIGVETSFGVEGTVTVS